MLEDKLEICVITYNRCKPLDSTLEQLSRSPFARCRVTVLDNASTDDTPEVCARRQKEFRDLRVVRHARNIGLSGNYLRAVEVSSSAYTWIVCDDDIFDFSECDDVIEAVESEEFDWIFVGEPSRQGWPSGQAARVRDLWKRGLPLFFTHTHVPSLIFRTETFDSACMTLGYHNAPTSYPHIPYLLRGLEQNFSEYISRRAIPMRDTGATAFGGTRFLAAAFTSALCIPDKYLRRRCIYGSGLRDRRNRRWLRDIAFAIVMDKATGAPNVGRHYAQMVLACTGEQRQRLLLLAPLVVVPSSVFAAVLRAWRAVRHRGRDAGGSASQVPQGDEAALARAEAVGDASTDIFRR